LNKTLISVLYVIDLHFYTTFSCLQRLYTCSNTSEVAFCLHFFHSFWEILRTNLETSVYVGGRFKPPNLSWSCHCV